MTHRYRRPLLALAMAALSGCSSLGHTHGARTPGKSETTARDEVIASEHAFAKTMADRNFKAFTVFVSGEAIFFSGNSVEHGSGAIAAAWRPYFNGPTAPFSWVPDNVQVLPSGKLALSTGPVHPGQRGRPFQFHLAVGGDQDLAHRLRQRRGGLQRQALTATLLRVAAAA